MYSVQCGREEQLRVLARAAELASEISEIYRVTSDGASCLLPDGGAAFARQGNLCSNCSDSLIRILTSTIRFQSSSYFSSIFDQIIGHELHALRYVSISLSILCWAFHLAYYLQHKRKAELHITFASALCLITSALRSYSLLNGIAV